MNLDISRHKELFNPDIFRLPVTIIGAGATGSWLALALAKLGIENITVWDFDVVEEHNIPNQAFRMQYSTDPMEDNNYTGISSDVGKSKTSALYQIINDATQIEIKTQNKRFVDQRLEGFVFMMVDSMKVRKQIWENSIKMKSAVKHLVEPRMGLDMGRIYNVNPTDLNHIKEYEDTYYDDDTAEVSACGNSMTIISSAMGVASWCTRQLINFANDEDLDNEILVDFKYNNIVTARWNK